MEWLIIVILVFYLLLKLLSQKNKGSPKARKRRQPFKKLYDLDKIQLIEEFERKMIRGMLKERKEIFVTAFCNDTHVLKVTASIGSKYSCRPSDNCYNWGEKAIKLGASQIRQYHNHPPGFGCSFPSKEDIENHKFFSSLVLPYGIKFHSFLVYPSILGKTKIKDYY